MAKLLYAEQRFALGQQRRKQMRRMEHAAWKAKYRGEDSMKLMEASMHGRIPALVALKYDRMAATPFGYFRGAVPVMAYDFSLVGNTGIFNQLCGDAHVRNLGAYAGPDSRLVFDINDFDETIAGPFEWDVKRMATSLVLAGREAGVTDANCRLAALEFLERYRRNIANFAKMPVLEVARFQVHRLRRIASVGRIMQMAQRATPNDMVRALTQVENKKKKTPNHPTRSFKNIPPNLKRVTGTEAKRVVESLVQYVDSLSPERKLLFSRYRPVDVAFKVVGTGSVGLRDYCIYMTGNGPGDALFLQIKEEVESGYAPYLISGKGTSKRVAHQGRRAVEGERLMQLASDPFLGWTTMDNRDYLVRQLNDHKASVQLKDLNQAGLTEYARVCGELLARGHARSGDSSMLAGYLGGSGNFDKAVTSFAVAYANQTERDWRELVRSRKTK
jgi:uncharacterized protein (DUF2252 family)